MKKILLITCALACTLFADIKAYNYCEGDVMTVVATSGLRLRMSPDINARTIHILKFGEMVVVVDTDSFVTQNEDRISWMDGHWVKVRYGNLAGYAFDGFLSTLTVPTHENQLCIDCNSVTVPLDRYISDNYTSVSIEEGSQHSEEIAQFVTQHDGGITATRTSGEGWYELEAVFEGRRLCEVLNLLRSMMVDDHLRQSFEDSLIFREDRTGHINKVEVTLYDNPIHITSENGRVTLSTVVFSLEDGC